MHTLSHRQERFVHEYAIDQNASAAAGRAGYSEKTRGTQAARLMQDPLVRERIQVELADLFVRLKLNATEVLQRQVRAAYLDPAKLFDARQEAIPLEQLDEDTREGLTVNYSRRTNGEQVMHVRQTPRHLALAVLQKRLDAFAKLQEDTYAQTLEREEREEQEAREAREKAEAALKPKPKGFFNLTFDLHTAAPAEALAPQPAAALPAQSDALPPEGRAPAHVEALAAAVRAAAPAPRAAASEPGIVPAPAAAAQPAFDPDAPPSPYEPGYDYKKDSNAAHGGRHRAWNLYQEGKKQEEQQAREAAAAGPAPNMRIGPGKRVMPRMEPGYNPPWLRDDRPRFAIGAGEFYFSGEEPY